MIEIRLPGARAGDPWSEIKIPLEAVLSALAYELVSSSQKKLVLRTAFSGRLEGVFQTTLEIVPEIEKGD